MKRFLTAALVLSASIPALAADVGLSMSIGQPGFYGSIDIGNYPRPSVVYAEPVIVQPVVGVAPPPMYLHVPPGQAKKWSRYCGSYHACGRPVLFVTDDWYERTYVPKYRERHGHGGEGGGHGKGHGKGHH